MVCRLNRDFVETHLERLRCLERINLMLKEKYKNYHQRIILDKLMGGVISSIEVSGENFDLY